MIIILSSEDDLKTLAAIPTIPESVNLECQMPNLGDAACAALTKILVSNTGFLKSLVAPFCYITNQGIGALAEALRENKLRILWLPNNQIGFGSNEQIHGFCDALSLNTSVLDLDISCNPLDLYTVQMLAMALSRNTHLKQLNLWRCGINNEKLALIADAIISNPHCALQQLTLGLGSFGLTDVARIIRHNQSLTSIDLTRGDNRFSIEDLTLLKSALEENRCLTKIILKVAFPKEAPSAELTTILLNIEELLERNRLSTLTKNSLGESQVPLSPLPLDSSQEEQSHTPSPVSGDEDEAQSIAAEASDSDDDEVQPIAATSDKPSTPPVSTFFSVAPKIEPTSDNDAASAAGVPPPAKDVTAQNEEPKEELHLQPSM